MTTEDNTPKTTALAVPTPNAFALEGMATDQLRVFTSLPMDTREGRAMMLETMQGEAYALADATGGTIVEVEHVLVHQVEFADEDGVAITGDRIVLVTPQGERFAAVSIGVRRSLQTIFALEGLPPYKPALKLVARSKKTRNGFRTLILSLA